MKRLVSLVMLALVAGIAHVGSVAAAPTPPPQAKGAFKTPAGETIGTVLLTQLRDGRVYISSEVKGLPAGEHGFTMREKGACTPDANAAGAVVRSEGLPTFMVMPNGMGMLEAYTTNVTVTPTDKTVFDADGTAIVITGFGNENAKVACAVLEPVPVPAPASTASTTNATAEFKTMAGETVGTATMTQNSDGSVRVQAQVRGLPPGAHAIHIHQFGTCEPVFGAAGEHHNPLNKTHGFRSTDPAHSGDLPNLTINADGTGTLDTTSALITLTPSDVTILDSDGSAVIIHALPDDEQTDPGGRANGRIACAVVRAASAAQPAQPVSQPTAGTPAQPAGGSPAQPVPAQLPSTGAADTIWFILLLAAVLLVSGGLVVRRMFVR
jgi:Cu-Zn family superoxide dismutase